VGGNVSPPAHTVESVAAEYGRAMPRFVALLRGISPSGTNMTNDKLRAVFEGLELEDVASVLSSGNIVFRSVGAHAPTLQQRIEDALASTLASPAARSCAVLAITDNSEAQPSTMFNALAGSVLRQRHHHPQLAHGPTHRPHTREHVHVTPGPPACQPSCPPNPISLPSASMQVTLWTPFP
jgi:hypothetical protein